MDTRPKDAIHHSPPSMRRLPYGDADGAVIPHAGRYARESVLLAFEMIGGVERMADWADKNPGEFFTRIYTKVITREVEVSASEGVEDLLARLDSQPHLVKSTDQSNPPSAHHHPEPMEAEYTVED